MTPKSGRSIRHISGYSAKRFAGLAVIIPSYNESRNLSELIPGIYRCIPSCTVYIIDDSDDKEYTATKKFTDLFRKKFRIELLHRTQKTGRGSAVILGISRALKEKKLSYFLEMDADLAHSPAEIPLFIKAADRADMIVGSRYLSQSRILAWPLSRLIQSKIINFVLRFWLGLPISDFTNGYRLYNRKAAVFLTRNPPKEAGFIALSEIAYKLSGAGFTYFEIPITFTDRKFGKSSATVSELIKSLVGVIRIRLSDPTGN